MLYYKQEDNRPQGGLPEKRVEKATPLPVKVQEWFFYVRNLLITFGSEK